MRKVLLTTVAMAAFWAVANAQTSFGLKAGANLAKLKVTFDNISASSDTKAGVYGGVFANIPLSPEINFQSEMVYSMEGGKGTEDGEPNSKFDLSYLNVPFLIQYVKSGVFVETGPQVGFLLSAKMDDGTETTVIKEGCEIINLSWAVGTGYKFSEHVGINARYNFGLSNIAKSSSGDIEGKLKSNVIQIGLFFPLNRGK